MVDGQQHLLRTTTSITTVALRAFLPKRVCSKRPPFARLLNSKPPDVLSRAVGHRSGKTSGRDTDKARRCAQEAFPWEEPSPEVLSAPKKIAIVPDSAALMTLRMVSKQVRPCSRGVPAVVVVTVLPPHASSYFNFEQFVDHKWVQLWSGSMTKIRARGYSRGSIW